MVGEGAAFRPLQTGYGTERINKKSGSGVTAPVLNGQEKILNPGFVQCKLEDRYKLSEHGKGNSLKTTEEFRKRLKRKPCEITKEQIETAKEKMVEFLHYLNGSGKKSEFEGKHLDILLQPPITAQQAANLVRYFYLKSAIRAGLEGKDVAEEMKECQATLRKVSLALKSVPQDEREMAFKLADGIRAEARNAAHEMVSMKRRLKKGLAEVDNEEAKLLEAVGLSYANRKLSTEERLQKKMMPLEDVLKKVGIPVGAALLVGSTREAIKAFIIDITEEIPLIASVPPEFIGLGIIGVWALVRFGKWLVDKRVRKTLDALPISKARALQDAKDAMNGKRDEMEQEFRSDMDARLGTVKAAYEQLLYEHSYARRG